MMRKPVLIMRAQSMILPRGLSVCHTSMSTGTAAWCASRMILARYSPSPSQGCLHATVELH